jgi:hypothetical protein
MENIFNLSHRDKAVSLAGLIFKELSPDREVRLQMYQSRGLKLKSYAGQTDNFEIYGGQHVIFSKTM